MNAISSAYAGLQFATQQMSSAASGIAGGDTSAGSVVALLGAQTDFSANIAMMKTAKSMDDQLVHMIDKFV